MLTTRYDRSHSRKHDRYRRSRSRDRDRGRRDRDHGRDRKDRHGEKSQGTSGIEGLYIKIFTQFVFPRFDSNFFCFLYLIIF